VSVVCLIDVFGVKKSGGQQEGWVGRESLLTPMKITLKEVWKKLLLCTYLYASSVPTIWL